MSASRARRRRSLGTTTPRKVGRNNDDEERRRNKRRRGSLYTPQSNAKMPGRLNTPAMLGWTSSRNTPNRGTPRHRTPMTKNALSSMYEKVLTRVNKNTINKKNAWDFKICSYIPELLQMEPENFPRSGALINATSIVLAARIDSVHDRGHKVWRNLVGSEKKPGDERSQDGENKKRKKYYKKILVDQTNLTIKLESITTSRDPLFEKTAAMFDEGGVKGLMVANLMTQKSGRLVFNGDVRIESFQDSLPLHVADKIPDDLIKMLPFKYDPECSSLCPQAALCRQTIDYYKKIADGLAQGLDMEEDNEEELTQKLNFDEDPVDNFEENEIDVVMDEFDPAEVGVPDMPDDYSDGEIPPCDQQQQVNDGGQLVAIVSENGDAIGPTIDMDQLPFRTVWQQDVSDINLKESMGYENLTTYFDQQQNWAGSQHWSKRKIDGWNKRRIAGIRRREALDGSMKAPQARKKRKVNYFEYENHRNAYKEHKKQGRLVAIIAVDTEEENIKRKDEFLKRKVLQEIDQRDFHQTDRNRICLPKKKIKSWKTENRVLPKDFKIDPKLFFKMSLRPEFMICYANNEEQGNQAGKNIDMSDDDDIYPSGVGFDDDCDDDVPRPEYMDGADSASQMPAGPFSEFEGDQENKNEEENQQPEINPVIDYFGETLEDDTPSNAKNKLSIPFSKIACDINVSKMKKRIWKCICRKGEKCDDDTLTITFGDLLREVIYVSPISVAEKITVNIIYVCLLYCCNEYMLELKTIGEDENEVSNFRVFTTQWSPSV